MSRNHYSSPPPSLDGIDALISLGRTREATLTRLHPQAAPSVRLDEWIATYRRIYDSGTGIRAGMPFPGSRAALAGLHAAGVPVVVASKGEASIHQALAHCAMRELVALVVGSRDASPEQIAAAACAP